MSERRSADGAAMCFGHSNFEMSWGAKLKKVTLHAQANAMIGVGGKPDNHTRMRRKAVGIGVIVMCLPSGTAC